MWFCEYVEPSDQHFEYLWVIDKLPIVYGLNHAAFEPCRRLVGEILGDLGEDLLGIAK